MHRCFLFAIAGLLAGVFAPPLSAQGRCEPTGDPLVSVLIEPGEITGIDRNLSIAVYLNGCVSVRLPTHYRRAGRYVVLATAAERAALAALVQQPELLNFSAAAVDAELSEARHASPAESFFYVADGDRFTLRIRDEATGKLTTLQYEAATQYAERYPQVVALKQLATTIEALLQYAAREDLIALESRP